MSNVLGAVGAFIGATVVLVSFFWNEICPVISPGLCEKTPPVKSRKIYVTLESGGKTVPGAVHEISFGGSEEFPVEGSKWGCVGKVSVDDVGAFRASSINNHGSNNGNRIEGQGKSDGSSGNCHMMAESYDDFEAN